MSILVYDTEVYVDYFLLMFKNVETGNQKYFELYENHPLDIQTIRKILSKNTIISFNGLKFDLPIIYYALAGASNVEIKELCDYIINGGYQPWQCEQEFGFKISQKLDHIDLFEVAPGKGSLKAYGGRLHCRTIQDLPINPTDSISPGQRQELITYCANDLQTTIDLYTALKPQIELREQMGKTYGMELRSKSDAQIAEAVIKKEVGRLKKSKIEKPSANVKPFKYKKPDFIEFQTTQLNEVLDTICSVNFVVTDGGKVIIPKEILDRKIVIGNSTYKIGVGGLHSQESGVSYQAKDGYILSDRDCLSYYPSIILQQCLYPEAMGKDFLLVYKGFFDERIGAKKSKNKVKADTLKIFLNGSFGKFGSKYSSLYSPHLLIQTTITGQLALLMLIERLEIGSVSVVSANTDGILIYCHKDFLPIANYLAEWWELATGFEIEETGYRSFWLRDVNNFFGLKYPHGLKLKGAYAPPGLSKNPTNEICSEAVVKFLDKAIPIEETINNCKDIRKFVTVRQVKGGAVKDNVYLGRVVRWYYSYLAFGTINYKVNGYTVPRSDGAMPLMTLPDEFPEDLDHGWYIKESYKILEEIGCASPKSKPILSAA